MSQPIRPGAASGPLVLADISGYTGFLSAVTDAHQDDAFADGNVPDAYALVSTLLDGIIETTVPPFTLAKVEGDAVFAYASATDELPHGPALLACLTACYTGFRERLAGAEMVWTCRCNACARVSALDLKFVVHAGPYVVHAIGGRQELIGSEVVMAHRLLKNHAADVVGNRAYALVTDAAATLLHVPVDGSHPLVEQYEHLPPVSARVFPLS